MDFNLYFSEEKIIKLLCKYRANAANKRHEAHMLRNVSLHAVTNRIAINQNHTEFIFLQGIFPPRRKWLKLKQSERKHFKDALSINQARLFKTYQLTKENIANGLFEAPGWFENLLAFVHSIQAKSLAGADEENLITQPRIKGIKKETKNGEIIYRPIALYSFSSKIICSLTSRYLIHFFDPLFLECSFAFRGRNSENHVPSHHDCIAAIRKYRKNNNHLWVAECDIQKFFDTVQHTHLLNVFGKWSNEATAINGYPMDGRAILILKSFLGSFSFQQNITPLNGDVQYFIDNGLPKGKFGWAEDDLKSTFGEHYVEQYRLGVPQGNAISCFVANLILHDVDKKVTAFDRSLFYIRYCDDMIIMHRDKGTCTAALDIYMEAIRANFLLFHVPIEVDAYRIKENSKNFWKVKSKKPFFWGDKHVDDKNVPWLSFVGYQMNFNGHLRVRKSTIKKEVKKQVAETQKVLRVLGKFNHRLSVSTEHARLSRKHIAFRLHQKLISMSVGRVKIHTHKHPGEQGLCWTNGFKMLEHNRISSQQLRYLDKKRNMQLMRVKKEMSKIEQITNKNLYPKHLQSIFYGSAFAYYNFLKHK